MLYVFLNCLGQIKLSSGNLSMFTFEHNNFTRRMFAFNKIRFDEKKTKKKTKKKNAEFEYCCKNILDSF